MGKSSEPQAFYIESFVKGFNFSFTSLMPSLSMLEILQSFVRQWLFLNYGGHESILAQSGWPDPELRPWPGTGTKKYLVKNIQKFNA